MEGLFLEGKVYSTFCKRRVFFQETRQLIKYDNEFTKNTMMNWDFLSISLLEAVSGLTCSSLQSDWIILLCLNAGEMNNTTVKWTPRFSRVMPRPNCTTSRSKKIIMIAHISVFTSLGKARGRLISTWKAAILFAHSQDCMTAYPS